ncbi:DUF4375 domain-containing protein [Luteolibacter sp. Populi]|uniref:DMP19 family protein n=1 Tax=Luteolibacter sp. Populi TaxID=3230487 RepID=UPI003467A466
MSKPFLEQYGGQTIDQLIAMQHTHRIDSIVLAIEQALAGRDTVSEAELTVLAVEALERSVNNGGYRQFFDSSSEYVPSIVGALERIGCPNCAAITGDAVEALALPADSGAISDFMSHLPDEIEDQLGKCDSRYYGNRESIESGLFAYIEKNRHEIRLPNSR